jgi:hypothetical protein
MMYGNEDGSRMEGEEEGREGKKMINYHNYSNLILCDLT